MSAIQNVVNFLLVIGVLVFFHELGHFLFAKLFKMKVEEFAMGFGNRLIRLGYDGETEYTIRLIPLGGFVRIKGMEVEDAVERRLTGGGDSEKPHDHEHPFQTTNEVLMQQEAEEVAGADPDGFNNRPIWQRFLVIAGGPAFSFLLGWLVLGLVGFIFGLPNPDKPIPVVSQVVSGTPAASAGIHVGERIVSVQGEAVKSWDQVYKIIQESPGKPISLALQAPEQAAPRTVTVTPKAMDGPDGKTVGRIGISPDYPFERVGLAESFAAGNRMIGIWFEMMGKLFVSGAIKDNVGGPIAIFDETRKASRNGPGGTMLLMGQLSLSLGLFNLFPIPVLDGGHIALMALEAVRRRKLTAEQTGRVFAAGLVILLAIFAAVMLKDITRLFTRG